MPERGRIQLHLAMPYKQQPADHPHVRSYLDRGYRIVSLDRVSDREALVTLEPSPAPAPPA